MVEVEEEAIEGAGEGEGRTPGGKRDLEMAGVELGKVVVEGVGVFERATVTGSRLGAVGCGVVERLPVVAVLFSISSSCFF